MIVAPALLALARDLGRRLLRSHSRSRGVHTAVTTGAGHVVR
ncbi:hypothetical protein [Streptomyces sp. NPDC058664]